MTISNVNNQLNLEIAIHKHRFEIKQMIELLKILSKLKPEVPESLVASACERVSDFSLC